MWETDSEFGIIDKGREVSNLDWLGEVEEKYRDAVWREIRKTKGQGLAWSWKE